MSQSRNDSKQAHTGAEGAPVVLDDDELDVAGANDKGLLVDFTIIGARIGNAPSQPGSGGPSPRKDDLGSS